jgi:uncharacterized protein (DUF433 family)
MGPGTPFGKKGKRSLAMKANQVITSSKDVLGGTLVFAGTRVPIKNLMDYLKTGHTIDDFLEDFPSVTRDQVAAVIDLARDQLTEAFDAHLA